MTTVASGISLPIIRPNMQLNPTVKLNVISL